MSDKDATTRIFFFLKEQLSLHRVYAFFVQRIKLHHLHCVNIRMKKV